ncbi:threonine-phosphate decarboxylase [Novosphingobium subterraneum]|uniref:threonine-phosphate decarboxylase n=1 Tax=Novosphingobium subterraneum TaxID=48936 RepID=UPI0010F75795
MIDEHAVTALTDWTVHGGRLSDAQRAFPGAPMPWLDLSTGINPEPWRGFGELEFDWQRLPDEVALHALETAAATCFGARSQQVLALPGTEFGLRGLASLGLPAPFRHVWPGYRTHAEALPESEAIPFEAVMMKAAQRGTIVLANPSNPDGRLVTPADLLDLARRLAKAGGWLVVDEAFVDAHADHSIVPLLDGSEPVIVTRSFGKFFGLAGVRLGFAVGPAETIARWRSALGSWPLSAAAIAIGTAAYADTGWIAATRSTLFERAGAMDGVLRRHGLEPTGACPQFRLVECDAAQCFERLAGAGILTRPFDYEPRWLRLGVPAAADELDRLDRALGHG